MRWRGWQQMRKHVLSKLQTLSSNVPPTSIFVLQFCFCKVSDLYGTCSFPSTQNRVTWVILDLGPCVYSKSLHSQETRRFSIAFTTARLMSLSWATLIQSVSFHSISFTSFQYYLHIYTQFFQVSFPQFSERKPKFIFLPRSFYSPRPSHPPLSVHQFSITSSPLSSLAPFPLITFRYWKGASFTPTSNHRRNQSFII